MFTTEATSSSFAEAGKKEELNNDRVVMVPVINLDARGGFLSNQQTDVAEYVKELIPFSTGLAQPGDFVIPMYGDSMYPRYPSGNRLLIRYVESWREYIELGASYVIELVDGRRVVKIVKKGSDKDHFLLVSVNPEFEDKEIPISIISHVFLVKLMLKNETV
ncbi:MAG: S24 family peptidase [Paludibacteraceae bacterium]|nr:S24 family peptidase [Paludibacteraceae bacterium]